MANLVPTTRRRRIPVDAIFNLRDLGGYATPEGILAWGRLYRADGLHRATEAAVDQIRSLGLRTLIDLRTRDELSTHGSFPCEAVGARYHHLPIIEAIWDPATLPVADDAERFLADRYIDMLLQGGESIATALAVLADADVYPAAFHCAAGKDRTGVLAAVVLKLVGVADDDIAYDYALSAEAMHDMVAWFTDNVPGAVEAMAAQPAAMLDAPAAAIVGVLDWVRAEYGSMRGYVKQLYVDSRMVDALRANLITA